jgi:protein-tyrosine phosphatase
MKLKRLALGLLCSLLVSCGGQEEVVETFNFHTDLQEEYLNDYYFSITNYASGKEELSYPKAYSVAFNEGATTLRISENEDMSSPITYKVSGTSYDIYNLKLNTTYYWTTDNLSSSSPKVFKTASKGPRNLKIDGITNCRDIGGYEDSIKQGLLYRTARLNENETTTDIITHEGKEAMLNLGVKTELDLRNPDNSNETGGITSSPLGESVNYINVPMKSGGNYLTLNKDVIKDVFEVLANKDNYPIFYHCSIGTDRTGVISMLVEGLMGYSEENIYRDYLFSNFGLIGGSRTFSTVKGYFDTISKSSGETTQEKFYNYLLSIGVSETNLNSIKSILSGE